MEKREKASETESESGEGVLQLGEFRECVREGSVCEGLGGTVVVVAVQSRGGPEYWPPIQEPRKVPPHE